MNKLKDVMSNRNLTVESKAIFAYLLLLSNDDNYIKLDNSTIVRDLDISKNKFFNHREFLIKYNYIKIIKKIEKDNYVVYEII